MGLKWFVPVLFVTVLDESFSSIVTLLGEWNETEFEWLGDFIGCKLEELLERLGSSSFDFDSDDGDRSLMPFVSVFDGTSLSIVQLSTPL